MIDPNWHWKAAPAGYEPGQILSNGELNVGHVGKGVDDRTKYRAMLFVPSAWSGEFPTFEAAQAGLLIVAEVARLEEAVWLLDRRAWGESRNTWWEKARAQLHDLGCSRPWNT